MQIGVSSPARAQPRGDRRARRGRAGRRRARSPRAARPRRRPAPPRRRRPCARRSPRGAGRARGRRGSRARRRRRGRADGAGQRTPCSAGIPIPSLPRAEALVALLGGQPAVLDERVQALLDERLHRRRSPPPAPRRAPSPRLSVNAFLRRRGLALGALGLAGLVPFARPGALASPCGGLGGALQRGQDVVGGLVELGAELGGEDLAERAPPPWPWRRRASAARRTRRYPRSARRRRPRRPTAEQAMEVSRRCMPTSLLGVLVETLWVISGPGP